MSGSSVEYSTGTNTKGATDETRHEATEARRGRIEGDLGQETDVGDPGPRDQIWQTGAGRGDAGDGTHGSRECHAVRARGDRGTRLLSDGSGSPEVGARGGVDFYRRPEGQGETSATQACRAWRSAHEVLRAPALPRVVL